MKGSLFRITPYMQEQMVWSGQLLVYEDASEMLRRLLRVAVDSSQIFRVSDTYGCLVGEELAEEEATLGVSGEDRLYVEADGSMVLSDEGYKEVKVGRTFRQSDCREKASKEDRGHIARSDYVAQLTDSDSFIKLFEPRLAPYQALSERMVFLTDGALWLDNWIRSGFPKATQILDFFHVLERLGKLAAVFFEHPAARADWVEVQRKNLLEKSAQEVIQQVQGLIVRRSEDEEMRQTTLTYLNNNLHRMNYADYQKQGLYIGSGAIESAHRTLIQDRMKRSGQRWSIEGANHMLNLRVCYKSDRWQKVVDEIRLMNGALPKAA